MCRMRHESVIVCRGSVKCVVDWRDCDMLQHVEGVVIVQDLAILSAWCVQKSDIRSTATALTSPSVIHLSLICEYFTI